MKKRVVVICSSLLFPFGIALVTSFLREFRGTFAVFFDHFTNFLLSGMLPPGPAADGDVAAILMKGGWVDGQEVVRSPKMGTSYLFIFLVLTAIR